MSRFVTFLLPCWSYTRSHTLQSVWSELYMSELLVAELYRSKLRIYCGLWTYRFCLERSWRFAVLWNFKVRNSATEMKVKWKPERAAFISFSFQFSLVYFLSLSMHVYSTLDLSATRILADALPATRLRHFAPSVASSSGSRLSFSVFWQNVPISAVWVKWHVSAVMHCCFIQTLTSVAFKALCNGIYFAFCTLTQILAL